jgi:hypothetical protein
MDLRLKEMKLYGTTSAGGALTVDASTPVLGLLYAVEWIDGTFDDGGTAVISCQNTASGTANTLLTLANPLMNADAWFYPRVLVHDQAGAALTGTSGGDRTMPVMNGVPRLVVSAGGATLSGGCILHYLEG